MPANSRAPGAFSVKECKYWLCRPSNIATKQTKGLGLSDHRRALLGLAGGSMVPDSENRRGTPRGRMQEIPVALERSK